MRRRVKGRSAQAGVPRRAGALGAVLAIAVAIPALPSEAASIVPTLGLAYLLRVHEGDDGDYQQYQYPADSITKFDLEWGYTSRPPLAVLRGTTTGYRAHVEGFAWDANNYEDWTNAIYYLEFTLAEETPFRFRGSLGGCEYPFPGGCSEGRLALELLDEQRYPASVITELGPDGAFDEILDLLPGLYRLSSLFGGSRTFDVTLTRNLPEPGTGALLVAALAFAGRRRARPA